MARIEIDPNYSSPTFSRATAGTDLFKKEDVQALAAAVSTHDHTTGKGAVLAAGSIPAGSITSGMIAEGTIVAGDIADGAVTSAKILDGTIATIDLADAAVTNAKLASDTARANLLTNGSFDVWQRGNGPFSTGSAYAADRWQVYAPSSIQRDTPTADGVGVCAQVTTSAPNSGLFQTIEGYQALAGRTVTVTVRIRTNTPTSVRVGFSPDKAGTLPAAWSAYHSGSSTYETLSATYAVPAGATGLTVWVLASVNNTFYIDNAMLVVGSVAADYAPLHPADDLARCLRYYELVALSGTTGAYHGLAQASSATNAFWPFQFKVSKAVTPTVTVSSPGHFSLLSAAAGALTVTAASVSAQTTQQNGLILTVGSGLVAGHASLLQSTNASAAISIESNP